jgi:hypothetical protein
MNTNQTAIGWLLQSKDPSVRYWTRVDVLGESPDSPQVRAEREQIPRGWRVRKLLAGQGAGKRENRSFATHTGGFGVHPYKKWNGAHWRLVSLVELGILTDDPRARAAADQVLCWLTSDEHRARIKVIEGRTRRCGSQEGNALAVCSRLGLVGDARVRGLARDLIAWQWDDGGWNCDVNPRAHHSSFYESLAPLWGLTEYHRATGNADALGAANRTAKLFLAHWLFRSSRTGAVIDPNWLKLHYPLYWHYDILQALVILSRLRPLNDPRMQEALDVIESKRLPNGCWKAEGCYWVPPGKRGSNMDVVDWGRQGANEMITLNALRVLKRAGRIT